MMDANTEQRTALTTARYDDTGGAYVTRVEQSV